MNEIKDDDTMLELQVRRIKLSGFWDETLMDITRVVESRFKPEIIRIWGISEVKILEKNKLLIKWYPRVQPLTDEELKEYGFQDNTTSSWELGLSQPHQN